MKGSPNNSSKGRSGFHGNSLPERQNRLKSERVQLELETANRVRKIVQRGAQGRFVQPRVLLAELPGVQIALRLGAGVGEVVVTASLLPHEPEDSGGPAAPAGEVPCAAA